MIQQVGRSASPPAAVEEPVNLSPYRVVFEDVELRFEFGKFLTTIFYQLDSARVFQEMDLILADPNKSDRQIFEELSNAIPNLKRRCPLLWQLWSLRVLKQGMGNQAASFLKVFNRKSFENYLEIYFYRYLNVIRKIAGLPLKGTTILLSDHEASGLVSKLEAGALCSRFPYNQWQPLNDPNCENPLTQPERTHAPISADVPDHSVDLVAALGGWHHIPEERQGPFVDSVRRVLKPGGVVLVREHNVTDLRIRAIVSVVHSFVNAAAGVSNEVEEKEVRLFRSDAEWTRFMQEHGFTRISPKSLILPDDPTQNGMMAFIRSPENEAELDAAIAFRQDYARVPNGTHATRLEWFNVRSSKDLAAYWQNHHAYASDYTGHLKQHWAHFGQYWKRGPRSDLPMNLFIATAATIQLGTSALTALPSRLIARLRHGPDWRNVVNLTQLEQCEARLAQKYSDFIDHTPFYSWPNLDSIRRIWGAVFKESKCTTKMTSALSATASTLGYLGAAAVSAPIRWFYNMEGNQEPETVQVKIHDPDNELQQVIDANPNHKIEVLYSSRDGYKVVSLPRYRPFTKIWDDLSQTARLQLLDVGKQTDLCVDVLLEKDEPLLAGTELISDLPKLQDSEQRRYVTYLVPLARFKEFQQTIGPEKIIYVHE